MRPRSRTFTAEVHRRAGGRRRSCTTFAQVRPNARTAYVNTAESARRARRNDDLSKKCPKPTSIQAADREIKTVRKVSEIIQLDRAQARAHGGYGVQGKCPNCPKTVRKCLKRADSRGNFVHCYGAGRKSVRKVSGVNVRVARARGGQALQGKCPKLSESVRSASAGRRAAFSAMARFGADMATAAQVDTTPDVHALCLRQQAGPA